MSRLDHLDLPAVRRTRERIASPAETLAAAFAPTAGLPTRPRKRPEVHSTRQDLT